MPAHYAFYYAGIFDGGLKTAYKLCKLKCLHETHKLIPMFMIYIRTMSPDVPMLTCS